MKLLDPLTKSRAQLEADELRREATAPDCAAICDCQHGDVVTVSGTVHSVSLRPRTTLPAYEIEVYDGTGRVTVVWIGRRRIPGIEAGRRIQIAGRLTFIDGIATVFNPKYELKPVRG